MDKAKKLLPGLVCLALILSFTLAIASPASASTPAACPAKCVRVEGEAIAASSTSTVLITSASPGLALSRYSGASGTSVAVTGSGFVGNETGVTVTWDGTPVAAGITASPQGTWNTTFIVPASSSGSHSVSAYGSKTLSPTVPVLTFMVTGNISLSQSSGAPGTSVTVIASGFGAGETGVTVTYDGAIVATGITAGGQGTWSTTFSVPASASGSHTITAYGSTTQASSIAAVTFVVTGSISLSRSSGAPGSSVTVTGSGFGGSETGITVNYDGSPVVTGVTASAQGAWTAVFTVPASTAGSHMITAYGSITQASIVSVAYFTVGAGISLSRSSGAPGSSVTVTGSGFGGSETGITVTYDGAPVATGITASTQGAWTATFTVPASTSGSHSISAYGAVTPSGSISSVTLMVTAGISLNRSSGAPGSPVTVTGSGFGATETGITVTWDGAPVVTGISARGQGAWSATFTVPASVSGAHSVTAYGPSTQTASVPEVTFIVGGSIALSQSTGASGNSLTVTGAGFGAGETGITVTYDGAPVATGITAGGQGTWSATFTVPASTSGSHTIAAYGSYTQAASVGQAGFTVMRAISVRPASGYVGTEVNVTGSGFAVNSIVSFVYDDADIPGEQATTDASGSFTKSIPVPKSTAGAHRMRAVDDKGNQAEAPFIVEATQPAVPSLVSPRNGDTVGILGDVTPTLRWSAITDPNGVTYVLQIDTSPDFTAPILEKAGITGSSYTLTDAEALPRGLYYWRVKAVNGTSDESAWAQPSSLKSGAMALWTLVTIIVLCILIAGIVVYLLAAVLARRRRKAIVVPELELPALGDWREARPEEPARMGAPARRRALPWPTKTVPRTSLEQQTSTRLLADFAQSLPLVEPGYTVDWIVGLVETSTGTGASQQMYEQLLQGQLQVRYEPPWTGHHLYQELRAVLGEHPVVQELDGFVEGVNRSGSEALLLLRQIYSDCLAEAPVDFLVRGGWRFIGAIYSDLAGWFRGKSLAEPSERDYSIRGSGTAGETSAIWLHGAETTSFAGPLIQAQDENEAVQLQALHLRLRRGYRKSERVRQLVVMIAQLEVQRGRLVNTLNQFSRLTD